MAFTPESEAHRLNVVEVVNFRSCKKLRTQLASFTPIIGYNNAGKSNFLAAINWLVKGGSLSARDFYDSNACVAVDAQIVGLTPHLLDRLHPSHRGKIEKYVASGELWIRRKQVKPGATSAEVKLWIKDPSVLDGDPWKPNPGGIDKAIDALFPEPFFIAAMEDAEEDAAKSGKSSTLGKFINQLTEAIRSNHGAELSRHLSQIEKLLSANGAERVPELVNFDRDATEAVQEFFPGVKLKVHIPIPEIVDLFRSGTIQVADGHAGEESFRNFSAYGHGTQRSIQMALICLLARQKEALRKSGKAGGGDQEGASQEPSKEQCAACNLLLIEEPELYLHPQAVEHLRLALRRLAASGYQVLFATHSPLMLCPETVPHTVMVWRTPTHGTRCRQTAEEAHIKVAQALGENPAQSNLIFELSRTKKWLFAHQVFICEGETENELCPELYLAYTGRELSSRHIALMGVGGVGNVGKTLRLFGEMQIPVRALVDLDYVFRNAAKQGFLEGEDPSIERAKKLFKTFAEDGVLKIADDGFPTKCNEDGKLRTSAEGFCHFAQDSAGAAIIKSLQGILREKGLWIWKRGAIESHLGLSGKGAQIWKSYKERLRKDGFTATVVDSAEVASFLDWLNQEPKIQIEEMADEKSGLISPIVDLSTLASGAAAPCSDLAPVEKAVVPKPGRSNEGPSKAKRAQLVSEEDQTLF